MAVQCWNLMGGLEWQALPVVAEMLGIADIEALVHDLVTIRNTKRENERNG